MKKLAAQGFTITEVLIVLVIAALILLIIFLTVPAVERNAQNAARQHDVGIIKSAIERYMTSQPYGSHVLPGWNGGECWEYDKNNVSPLTQATNNGCVPLYNFVEGFLPQMEHYTKIDQYFLGTDNGAVYDGQDTVPLVINGQSINARIVTATPTMLSSVVANAWLNVNPVDFQEYQYDPDEIFIDSSKICLNQYGDPNYVENSYNEQDVVIIYEYASANGTPSIQCDAVQQT